MSAVSNPPHYERFPVRFLTLAMLLTGIAVCWLGWNAYKSYRVNLTFQHQYFQIEQLQGTVKHLDEVLTMSARMAVATGDRIWEDRYLRFEPTLDRAIQETIRLAPDAYSGADAVRTGAANAKLVDMEHRAFDLLRQDRQAEARAVLFSSEYETQKQIYTDGMSDAAARLRDTIDHSLLEQREAIRDSVAVLAVVPMLLLGWLLVFRLVNRWQRRLVDNNRELLDLNEHLDARVSERTAELEENVHRLKDAEAALNATSARLNAVFDAATQVSIIATDVEGLITVFNRGAEKLLGYTSDEVIGKATPKLFHLESEVGARSKELTKELGRNVEGFDVFVEVARRSGNEEREWTYVRKNGSRLTVNLGITPLRDAKGQINGFLGIAKNVTHQKHVEAELKLASQMSDLLQSCSQSSEAYTIVAHFCAKLLPNCAGALYLFNASRNLLRNVISWNGPTIDAASFDPEDCWALRRGHPHVIVPGVFAIPCAHLKDAQPEGHACLPLMAEGMALGIMYLEDRPQSGAAAPGTFLNDEDLRVATTFAGRVALALSNLVLQEALRVQSVRDPLTGLFNRRYLEESFERELHRMERRQQAAGFAMIDIDHFKTFNDMYGHDAGDAILRAFGQFLREHLRREDIACRYGGEEFCILFCEATLDTTVRLAEELRSGVKRLSVQHGGRQLGEIAISIGVASYPVHGSTITQLISTADNALYQAKNNGRDRVIAAQIPDSSPVVSAGVSA